MIDSFVDKAILEINPNAKFSIDADDTSRITWLEGTSPISENDIISKINELRADYNSKEYQAAHSILKGFADRQHQTIEGAQYWIGSSSILRQRYQVATEQ